MKSNAVVNGIIDFAGGTAPGAATTMNSSDTITGTGVNDSLKVTLQNSSGAIGGGSSAVAQVDKITVPTVTADVAQVNQYVFAGSGSGTTKTFTYGSSNGSYTYDTASTGGPTSATNFAASLNAVAGSTVATVGSSTASSAIATTGVVTLGSANTGLKVGMAVTSSNLATFYGYIKSIDSDTQVTLDRTLGSAVTSSTIAFGGGTAGVTVIAPTAGTPTPAISFGDATVVTQSLNVANVAGNQGDVVTFTYNGLSGSYVIGASIDATATNLKNALTATIPTSQAVAAVVDNGSSDYVTLTAATAGTALSNLVFSGSSGNMPTVTITTANVPATGGISFGNNSGLTALYANNITGYGATIDQNSVSGTTQLWSDRSSGAVTFTNVGKTTTVGINGNGTSTALGALTATYVAGTTAANVAINGGATAGAVTVNANADGQQKTVNVSSTGGAQASSGGQVNTIASLGLDTSVTTLNINAATSLTATAGVTGSALTTITASGAGTTVNLGTLASTVTSVNASGMTAGGVTATLTGNTKTFVGGAGVDTITTGATTASGALIDGGAGSGDILVLAATNDVTTAAKAAQYVNFEVLRNTYSYGSASNTSYARNVDMSLFSNYTAVQANAGTHRNAGDTADVVDGAGFINMTATQAAAVTNRSNNSGATFALTNATGSTDVLTVTLNNATPTTGAISSASLKEVTVNGFETMNVVSSSGNSTSYNELTFKSSGAADLKALNLSGVAPIALTTTNLVQSIAIDGSQLTYAPTTGNYNLTVAGDLVKGSSVTGSATADNITTTSAITGSTGDFVTYTLGGGNDAIASTVTAINNTSAAKGSVKIAGGDGTDTLTLKDAEADGITMVDNSFQYLTGIEKIVYGSTTAEDNGAMSITTGGFFNTNFASAVTLTLGSANNSQANTVNLSSYTGNATVSLDATAATTNAQTLYTGSGNDTVTLLVGGETAGSTVNLGAGNDSLAMTVKTSSVSTSHSINGGAGQDSIVLTGATAQATNTSVTIVVNSGQSTTSAYDSVSGVALDVNSSSKFGTLFDFDGSATVMGDVSATPSVISGVNYAVTNGLMSFSGTGATTLTLAQKIQIAVAADVVANKTVAFLDGADSYIYHMGVTTSDVADLVKLVGTSVAGLESGSNFTNNFAHIA